ncbi:MAG: hypothetical protein IIC87_07825 [Chloroflexi bacterium]|nr:hypothetical protein [Chloroflexota bacterium]
MTRPLGNPQSGRQNGLTGIPRRIHWAATPTEGNEASEADQIMIDHFLDTLADIATAVAQRACKGES